MKLGVATLGGLTTGATAAIRALLPGRSAERPPSGEIVPVLRRADAHPDAPARAPLLATRDLGTPFLEITARGAARREPRERRVPLDLDQKLSAFDPDAILAAPQSPADLDLDEGERFEAFELTPPASARPAPPPGLRPVPLPPSEAIATPRTDAKVHALLDRLERGMLDRTPAAPRRAPLSPRPRSRDHTLEDALATLRMLARTA